MSLRQLIVSGKYYRDLGFRRNCRALKSSRDHLPEDKDDGCIYPQRWRISIPPLRPTVDEPAYLDELPADQGL